MQLSWQGTLDAYYARKYACDQPEVISKHRDKVHLWQMMVEKHV